MTTSDRQSPPRLYDTAAMQNTLIAQLIKTYKSGSRCASALGMSRQAFNAALARQHLSESKAMLAAILLNIDPAAALLANSKTSTTNNPPAPVENPAPNLPAELHITNCDTTNYAILKIEKLH